MAEHHAGPPASSSQGDQPVPPPTEPLPPSPTVPLPGDQAAPPGFATAGPPREALVGFWRRLARSS